MVRFSVGKAHYQHERYDPGRDLLEHALATDPTVPEAGWARSISSISRPDRGSTPVWACGCFEVEPDPPRPRPALAGDVPARHRSGCARIAACKSSSRSGGKHPACFPWPWPWGLAQVRQQPIGRGNRGAPRRFAPHPDSARGLGCLAYRAGGGLSARPAQARVHPSSQEFGGLDPRFAKHEGNVAAGARDWPRAVGPTAVPGPSSRITGPCFTGSRMVRYEPRANPPS